MGRLSYRQGVIPSCSNYTSIRSEEDLRQLWIIFTCRLACSSVRDLPAVDLVELDGFYYARPGQNRISVAQTLCQLYINAEITCMHIHKQAL